jgi:drug/metabolite transporter (DMT)-like permease
MMMDKRLLATLIGGVAILLWCSLALLTALTGTVPPLQLTAFSFGLGFALMLVRWLVTGVGVTGHFRLPAVAWLVGVGGLFGYHALYFIALRLAPPAEASLVNYLWPLLIVLFSAFLPGERLHWFHVAGAVLGFAGTVLIVSGAGIAFQPAHLPGYAVALACAVTWAVYSVLSRRLAAVPTDAVGAYCLVTALLALVGHLVFEVTHWPDTPLQWGALVLLGLGPAGSAFFFWDHGMKRGDIRALGAASYAAPLVSTLLLVAAGLAVATWQLGLACLLIAGGGVLGAGDLWRRRAS